MAGKIQPSRYPLQMTGFHFKGRVHSSYGNIDVLKQACRQEIWINPIDARDRGIKNGDTVRVFNQYGQTLIPAKVTPRIMPGVTAMGEECGCMPICLVTKSTTVAQLTF